MAVWFNVNFDPEPIHGCLRSIQIPIVAGSSAFTVATNIRTILDADSEFDTTFGNPFYAECSFPGARTDATSETSGFTISTTTQGEDPVYNVITSVSGFNIFSILTNTVKNICDDINTKSINLTAAPVGDDSLIIDKKTSNDFYTYTDNSSALAYGHTPGAGYVKLYDGESYVKFFENTNPNFVLKRTLILNDVVSFYNTATCPNYDSSEVGEYFKLIPTSIYNIHHHLTHKSLSQLSIVADVDICSNYRKLQIKSKEIGSEGSVEIAGGRGNEAIYSLIGDPTIGVYAIELRTQPYPVSINTGDIVSIYNTKSAKRINRFIEENTITTEVVSGNNINYILDPIYFTDPLVTKIKWIIEDERLKPTASWSQSFTFESKDYINNVWSSSDINIALTYTYNASTSNITFTVIFNDTPSAGSFICFEGPGLADNVYYWFRVGGLGSPPAVTGIIIPIDVTPGDDIDLPAEIDLVYKYNSWSYFDLAILGSTEYTSGLLNFTVNSGSTSFYNTNKNQYYGNNNIAGFIVDGMNINNSSIDFINPYAKDDLDGFLLDSLSISPEIISRIPINHMCNSEITNIVVGSSNMTITSINPHFLNVGDSVVINEADYADLNDTFTVTSIVDPYGFVVAKNSTLEGTYNKGVFILNAAIPTKYAIEKMGFNNLFKLRANSVFDAIEYHVEVGGFVVLSGDTFKSINHGRYRILAKGKNNNYLVIQGENLIEELNTYHKINNRDMLITWNANSNTITGLPGSFYNLSVGDWIKKPTDGDEYLLPVIAMNGTAEIATSITLGGLYNGSSDISGAVFISFEEGSSDCIGEGSTLQSIEDVIIYKADSAILGDQLVIDQYIADDWFSANNSGNFTINYFGSNSGTQKNYIQIQNPIGTNAETADMSVRLDGFYILESESDLFESVGFVTQSTIDPSDSNYRKISIKKTIPSYKVNQGYGTKIKSLGKIGFNSEVKTGIDGYLYYSGLLRTVQRIIDGYEPDLETYPGKKAIGSKIEILPPVMKKITITIDIETKYGSSIIDITNDIKSTIVRYVSGLGVGESVILSEIIARSMDITGLKSITFIDPTPNTEKINVANHEKVYINPEDIYIS